MDEQAMRQLLMERSELMARLAAGIAMTISCIIWLPLSGSTETAVFWGLWTAGIGYGATFALAFYISLAKGLHKSGTQAAHRS